MNHQLPAISSAPTRSTLLTTIPGLSPEHHAYNAWNDALATTRSQIEAYLLMERNGYHFDAPSNSWV